MWVVAHYELTLLILAVLFLNNSHGLIRHPIPSTYYSSSLPVCILNRYDLILTLLFIFLLFLSPKCHRLILLNDVRGATHIVDTDCRVPVLLERLQSLDLGCRRGRVLLAKFLKHELVVKV
jgi:hypothetical protein